jgi:alpha-methylacyl-CoA racemase
VGGPLAGVQVLDLSAVGPGSRCTAALRDLGASVTKIGALRSEKRPEPRFFAYGGLRGMRRVRIDLRADRGRSTFLGLVRAADVVVESFRPGVAERLGVGYEQAQAANAGIVYCSVTGYGQVGPSASFAGHDLNYLATGGYLGTQGRRADGGPAMPGATIADAAAGGLHAALAIAAALYQRATGGSGCFLDVSTADGVLHLMSLFVDEYLATGVEVGPGSALLTGGFACYDLYAAGDGKWLAVAAIEPAFFANLCRELGLVEWAAAQYDESKQDELRTVLRDAFATRGRDEWVQALAHLDTCVAAVRSVAEVADAAEHLVVQVTDPQAGSFRQLGPVLAGTARPAEPVVLPGTETHVEAVLADAGFSADDIAGLVAEGVVE